MCVLVLVGNKTAPHYSTFPWIKLLGVESHEFLISRAHFKVVIMIAWRVTLKQLRIFLFLNSFSSFKGTFLPSRDTARTTSFSAVPLPLCWWRLSVDVITLVTCKWYEQTRRGYFTIVVSNKSLNFNKMKTFFIFIFCNFCLSSYHFPFQWRNSSFTYGGVNHQP